LGELGVICAIAGEWGSWFGSHSLLINPSHEGSKQW